MVTDAVRAEIDGYLTMPCLPEETNPLVYWKDHRFKFPTLVRLIPKFLHVPGTSAPVERLFSTAGKIFCPEKCSLSAKTFETLMFVRSNMD